MRKLIENQTYDEERALYHTVEADIKRCTFAGPADGESVLKESRNIGIFDCSFSLRYPVWHVKNFVVENTVMDELTRAAIWYSDNGRISSSRLLGVKAVRECKNIFVSDSEIVSTEFGWKSDGVTLLNTQITAEYLFLDSKNIKLDNVKMKGKYSFQYVENLEITNSYLDTKDAFWHAKNVIVKDSTVKGEYLGWFSENLTLINCKIIGTQPLCYCKKLKLVNCTTEDCDLSFEYSETDADIVGNVISVKNVLSGVVRADSVGEIIEDDEIYGACGKVEIKK